MDNRCDYENILVCERTNSIPIWKLWNIIQWLINFGITVGIKFTNILHKSPSLHQRLPSTWIFIFVYPSITPIIISWRSHVWSYLCFVCMPNSRYFHFIYYFRFVCVLWCDKSQYGLCLRSSHPKYQRFWTKIVEEPANIQKIQRKNDIEVYLLSFPPILDTLKVI